MNNQPLLTVIVPCYNVEKYIDKCLLSIVGQIYTNLEILLINDGSTDSTGKICDEWQERDPRIKVVNKQNEGLAYARKTGLEHTTGECVAFVDSDDWIDKNMYSDMMSELLITNSDIAMSKYCRVFEDGSIQHNVNKQEVKKTMNRVEAMTMILNDSDCTSFCIYIFKKNLFENIIFPKGRGCSEDLIIHHLFHKSSQAVYLDKSYYFYFQRKESISRDFVTKQAELKIHSDFSDGYYERYSFVIQHPEYHSVLPFVLFMTAGLGLSLLRNIIVYPLYFSDEYYKLKVKQMRSITLPPNSFIPGGLKAELFLLKINPKLYKFVRSLYVGIINVTNRLKITNRETNSPYWNILFLEEKNYKSL